MLSEVSQQRLAQLIATIAEGEQRTEMVRQVLAEQQLFEPLTTFKRIDRSRRGYLVNHDITNFLKEKKISYTSNQADYLFKRLDQDRDEKINYSDFVKSILPLEDMRLRQIASLRKNDPHEKQVTLPHEVEWTLSKLFEQEIMNYKEITKAQDLLLSSKEFNTMMAFKSIDKQQLGYVTIKSLNNFLRRNGIQLSEDEVVGFFNVVDQDKDGRISYTELMESMFFAPHHIDHSDQKHEVESQHNKKSQTAQFELQKSRDQLDQLKLSREMQEEIMIDRNIDELHRNHDRLDKLIDNNEQLKNYKQLRSSGQRLREIEDLRNMNRRKPDLSSNLSSSRIEVEDNEFEQAFRRNELLRNSQNRLDQLIQRRYLDTGSQSAKNLLKSKAQNFESQSDLRRADELKLSRERLDQIEQLKRSRELQEELYRNDNQLTQLQQQKINQQIHHMDKGLNQNREKLQEQLALKRSRDRLENSDYLNSSRQSTAKQSLMGNVQKRDSRTERIRDIRTFNEEDRIRRSQERLKDLDRQIREQRIHSEIQTLARSRVYDSPYNF